MSNYAKSVVRDFIQKLLGVVFAWVGVHVIAVPKGVEDAVTNWAVLGVTALLLLVWTAVVRWLESRPGTGSFAVWSRALGRILMLGVGSTPVYLTAAKPASVNATVVAPAPVVTEPVVEQPVVPTTTVGPDGTALH